MQTDTTRRQILALGTSAAAYAAGAAIVAGGVALAKEAKGETGSTIASIERLWQERCRAYREFESDAEALDDDEKANRYWDRISAAEVAIHASRDTSARATEIKLWVAWDHARPSCCGGEDMHPLVAQGDVAALRRAYPKLDWYEKMIFSAILSLRGEAQA